MSSSDNPATPPAEADMDFIIEMSAAGTEIFVYAGRGYVCELPDEPYCAAGWYAYTDGGDDMLGPFPSRDAAAAAIFAA